MCSLDPKLKPPRPVRLFYHGYKFNIYIIFFGLTAYAPIAS